MIVLIISFWWDFFIPLSMIGKGFEYVHPLFVKTIEKVIF